MCVQSQCFKEFFLLKVAEQAICNSANRFHAGFVILFPIILFTRPKMIRCRLRLCRRFGLCTGVVPSVSLLIFRKQMHR